MSGPLNATSLTWNQTAVVLSANTAAPLVAANGARRGLRWMNVGSNPMTVVPGTGTPTAGSGMNYSPPSQSGYQGGSDSFDDAVSGQAFTAISTSGTTVIVWEGS